MPTPSLVGTPSQVDCSAASGSTSVTVPTGCNLVVAFWSHWHNNSNSTLSTLTLGGSNMLPALAELAEGATFNEPGVGVAILVNPPTGAQTLAWAWSDSAARTEGGGVFLVYYQDANTSDPYRAVAVDAQTGTTQPAATINSTASDDRVVGFTENSNPSTNPTPTITGVTAVINNTTINTHVYDVGDATGLTGNVTVGNSTPDHSAAAAISLKASAGATIEQEGFRFGTDDGSESTHGWPAAQDTDITAPVDQSVLLRILANQTGTVGPKKYKLEYQRSTDPSNAWKKVT